MKPRVFIASSSEGLSIATALHKVLAKDTEATLWNSEFFAGKYILKRLEEHVHSRHFGILVASPDDQMVKRGDVSKMMRDNVLLELGMFLAAVGRE